MIVLPRARFLRKRQKRWRLGQLLDEDRWVVQFPRLPWMKLTWETVAESRSSHFGLAEGWGTARRWIRWLDRSSWWRSVCEEETRIRKTDSLDTPLDMAGLPPSRAQRSGRKWNLPAVVRLVLELDVDRAAADAAGFLLGQFEHLRSYPGQKVGRE